MLHASDHPHRKNALFAGSDGGAENDAVIASLIETRKPPTSIRSLSRTWTAATWSFGRHMPGSAAYAQQPAFLNSGCLLQCERAAVRPSAEERSTVGEVRSMCQIPAGTSMCEWTGTLAPGGFLSLRW